MSTFEELLNQEENTKHYEKMKQCLIYIVQTSPDPYYLARFLEPFLSHVNSPSLNDFHITLQNAANSQYILPTMIHNVINECRTNERLLQVIDLMIRKYL